MGWLVFYAVGHFDQFVYVRIFSQLCSELRNLSDPTCVHLPFTTNHKFEGTRNETAENDSKALLVFSFDS